MRRCRGIKVFDVLGGYIPNITSGCHRRRGRGLIGLLPDSCYSKVTNQRFALSGAWSAPILQVGSERGTHLVRDEHISLHPFSQEVFIEAYEKLTHLTV